MKTNNNNSITTRFYNQKAEKLMETTISQIKSDTKVFAIDLSKQKLPREADSQELYIPKIKGWFETLLQKVLQIIAGFAVLNQTPEYFKEMYDREAEKLKVKKEELLEDVRLLEKQIEGLTDVSKIIQNWIYKWRPILILLTFGEVAINYKALLSVTPNQIVSIFSAIGLSIFLFITAHSFKSILNFFQSRNTRIFVGITNIVLVLMLLFGLNEIRLSYMENDGAVISDTSRYSFIALNTALWISGVVISLLYKPLKPQVQQYHQYQKTSKELGKVRSEIAQIDRRLDEIPKELDEKLMDLENLKSMGRHYESIISAEYRSCVAEFQSENLFARKDKVTPKAFLKEPPKLQTYFDNTTNAHYQS